MNQHWIDGLVEELTTRRHEMWDEPTLFAWTAEERRELLRLSDRAHAGDEDAHFAILDRTVDRPIWIDYREGGYASGPVTVARNRDWLGRPVVHTFGLSTSSYIRIAEGRATVNPESFGSLEYPGCG
jgi:hypothetical protein